MNGPESSPDTAEVQAGTIPPELSANIGGVALLTHEGSYPEEETQDSHVVDDISTGTESEVYRVPITPEGQRMWDQLQAEFDARWAEEDAQREAEQAKKDVQWQEKLPGLIETASRIRAVNGIINKENPVIASRGVLDENPGQFGGEDYVASRELSDIFSAVSEVDEENEIGLSPVELETVTELNAAIAEAAQRTAKKLRFQAGSAERKTYVDEESAREEDIKPFEKQLRYILCRTIHMMNKAEPVEGGPLETAAQKMDVLLELIKETPQLIEDVYATDIPLYEKVLADFDKMRQENPDMLEVYLARDGIFAYYGRRAQAAVRRGLLDPETRREMRETGEVKAYIPKYKNLLVNRKMVGIFDDEGVYFESDFSTGQQEKANATIEAYLKQESLEEEDPHFFDTGFEGSIPEKIMEMLGYSKSEINRRIHMLSSYDSDRRSKGLLFNHRRAALDIEHHRPKLTHSAEGYAPNKEGERIQAVTEPSSPEDTFKSLVIREAIHRHFWYRERAKTKITK